MVDGSKGPKAKDWRLVALLCILQWLVVCQEKFAKWLDSHSGFLQSVRQLLSPSKGLAKKRGSKPEFPSTVAFILTEEWVAPQTLDDLTRLIHRSAATGINHLQIYEKSGLLKARGPQLSSRLNFHTELYAVQASSYESKVKDNLQNTDSRPRVRVTLLSAEDAQLPLTLAIKAGRRQVFGPVFTLAGFPPWLVRQSEIHSMGNLSSLQDADIQRGLQNYCQTTQRFGR